MSARTDRTFRSSRRDVPSVCVAGGGPAGAAAAIRLRAHGFPVTLYDAAPQHAPGVGERLAPQGVTALHALGVWPSFVSGGHLRSPGLVSAWASALPTVVDDLLDPFGTAWHLDRPAFDEMLRDAAVAAGVCLLRNTRVTGVEQNGGGRWSVAARCADRRATCDADVVIDARGRQPRDLIGRPRPLSDDRLVATVFVFAEPLRAPQSEWTLVESCRDGWWYSAPLPGGRSSVAFFTDADLRTACADVLRLARLTGAALTPDRVPRAAAHGLTVRCPALSQTGHAAPAPTLVPVGDAAGAPDPLSGSGLSRSLDTAIQAADAIAAFGAGRADALPQYMARLEAAATSYAKARRRVYALERRWLDAPFWRRRADRQSLEAG